MSSTDKKSWKANNQFVVDCHQMIKNADPKELEAARAYADQYGYADPIMSSLKHAVVLGYLLGKRDK